MRDQNFLNSSLSNLCILEVGAGQGEHIEYVKNEFSEYVCLDLFEKPKNWTHQYDQRLLWMKGDISKLDFDGKKFDRIIVMCVFHHLKDPFPALKNIESLLNDDGVLTFFLPSDPGVLNRMNRKIFVSPKAKKLGFSDYALVNAIEHRNHYWGLKLLVDCIFMNYKIDKRYYPLNIPSANLSLFSIWNVQKRLS
jgi:SAM-dependent methyltransferase